MVLGGLWHGASWSFAVWGAFHGLLLIIERLVFKIRFSNLILNFIYSFVKILIIFTLVSFAWLLFKLPNFNDVILFLGAILNNLNLEVDFLFITKIITFSLPIILYHFIYLIIDYKLIKTFFSKFQFVFYAIIAFLIFTNSGISGSFIYFQF